MHANFDSFLSSRLQDFELKYFFSSLPVDWPLCLNKRYQFFLWGTWNSQKYDLPYTVIFKMALEFGLNIRSAA